MRIQICLVSRNKDANEFVRKERQALIPRTSLKSKRMEAISNAEISIRVYDPETANRSLAQYLLEKPENQVIVLLIDSQIGNFANDVASACFVADVALATHPRKNYKNYFAGTLTRLLKNLTTFLAIIEDSANEQAMLLPFRNFNARQLHDLREVCRNEALSPDFANIVTKRVEDLKNRRRPRRNSNYSNLYFVDDDDKIFQYGLEHHAQLATGAPHTPLCALTGKFRFGRRIATDRHYNVTKELGPRTKIAGNFPDCHDHVHSITPTTHLNIFSNDYRA